MAWVMADAEVVFTSSGTTGMVTSSHTVTDVSWYVQSFRKAFQLFYGDIQDYTQCLPCCPRTWSGKAHRLFTWRRI
jgi:hypothetical protein